MKKVFNIDSLQHMEVFAATIAESVFPGFVIGLAGDLGAGKTTFTQFFGKALGVRDSINSPTFTIMKHYEGRYFLTHIDAYRLEGSYSDESLEAYIFGDGISVVEWWPYIKYSMPDAFLSIKIVFIEGTKRRVEVEGSGKYEYVIRALSH